MDREDAKALIQGAFQAAFDAHGDGDTYEQARERLWAEFVSRGLANEPGAREFSDELAEAVHNGWPVALGDDPE